MRMVRLQGVEAGRGVDVAAGWGGFGRPGCRGVQQGMAGGRRPDARVQRRAGGGTPGAPACPPGGHSRWSRRYGRLGPCGYCTVRVKGRLGRMEAHDVKHGRVMALDVGKVRIGVALTDPLGYTAQPLVTIWRKGRGEDLRSLTRLVKKHEVTVILVGNPLHISGDVSPWAKKVQEFAEELRAKAGVPVELWDERLSSVAAHEILDEAGHDRVGRKTIIDQVAAVVILRDWMEAKEQATAKARVEEALQREG